MEGAGEGPTHRKTRGKRVGPAAPVWAVGWGPGRMSGMQRQGTECGKASEAWLLSSCSPGDLSAQACQVSQSPGPSYAPQDLLIVQTRITLWWIPRGETGKPMVSPGLTLSYTGKQIQSTLWTQVLVN